VYFIVIVPADESNDAEIMDDLAKSEEEVGHAVAVLSVGGWQRDGATAQRSSINTTETPCEGIMQQRLLDQRSCFLPTRIWRLGGSAREDDAWVEPLRGMILLSTNKQYHKK
jgi:hypothetical protein